MKTLRHAVNVACLLILWAMNALSALAEWAIGRVTVMSFGDGPRTIKEWVEAVIVLAASVWVLRHFL